MLLLYDGNDQPVDLRLGAGGAGQGGIPAKVLVVHRFQCHHIKFIAHAVLSEHGTGQAGSLLNIIGGAGGDGTKLDFLRGAAAGEGSDLIFDLLFVH